MNDLRELKAIIEAVLYIWAEPIHIDEIAKIIDKDKKTTKKLLDEIQLECEHYRRGIILNSYDMHYQFSTRIEHESYISKLVKSKNKRGLSNSSMETLALIAYKQPITRMEIDDIRGVKSYSSIELLLSRGLIEERGRLDKIGKPKLYGTTVEFLRLFDLKDISNLPSINNLDSLDNVDDEN